MGGNSPSHFSHEDDGEGGGITFVKGIRLSDRVINRMRESPKVVKPSIITRPPSHSSESVAPVATPVPAPSVEHLLPLLVTPPPLLIPTAPPQEPAPSPPPAPSSIHPVLPSSPAEPVKFNPPPPVKFHSPPPVSMEPIPLSPLEPPPADPVVSATPQPPTTEPGRPPVALSAPVEPVLPLEPASPPPAEPVAEPPSPPSLPEVPPPIDALVQLHVEPEVLPAPPVVEPRIEPLDLTPPVEPVAPPELVSPNPPTAAVEATPPVAPSETLVPPVPGEHIPVDPSTSIKTALVGLLVETPPPVEAISSTSAESVPTAPVILQAPVETVPALSVVSPTDPDPSSLHVPPLTETTPSSNAPPPEPPSPEPPSPEPPSPAPFSPPEHEPVGVEAPPPCCSMELTLLPADPGVIQPSVTPVDPPPPTPPPLVEQPASAPSPPPQVEDLLFAVSSQPPPAPEVDEEELRRTIKEELQRNFEQEISQKKQQLLQQLEEAKAQATAEAKAAAQAQVAEQVKEYLAAEKAINTETLRDDMETERMKTADERLMAQLYWMELKAHKLDKKEKMLQNQEILFREHIKKLEAKSAQFYRVSTENFQQGKEDAHKRFKRLNIKPACGDLQSQILRCYRENTGRTLCCSAIASAYMECVDNAKKNKLSTRG